MLVALFHTLLQVGAASPAPAHFENPRLQESSGVVVSRTYPGLLWTHNDAGNEGYLYATDVRGRDRGRLRVPGVRAVDWEDLARGPCPRRTTPPAATCLYIADTGDNREQRSVVSIYAVPEPRPPQGAADSLRATAAPVVLRLQYSDGPHNVEALYVTPRDTTIYLVSKGTGTGRGKAIRVYHVARREWEKRTGDARWLQTLDIRPDRRQGRVVTGAAIRPDGGLVAIRTYSEVYLFYPGADGRLTPLPRPPRNVTNLGGGGEAIDFINDSTLVLTNEASRGQPGRVYVLPLHPATPTGGARVNRERR